MANAAILDAPRVPDLTGVAHARGYFEVIEPPRSRPIGVGPFRLRLPLVRYVLAAPVVWIRGWMLMPDGAFDQIAIYLNGRLMCSFAPMPRPDLAATFAHIRGAAHAGFKCELPRPEARQARLTVVGLRRRQPTGKMSISLRRSLMRIPTPPGELMQRVTGHRDAAFFKISGVKQFGEFRDALERHRPVGSVRRLLDWGCGCGRVAVHWVRMKSGPMIFGADVDGEAIRWCNAHLRGGSFTSIPFQPPMPYPDGFFDVITSHSVFTHLDRDAQRAWLGELRRVLAPDGIILASVHGPSATWFAFGSRTADVLRNGIHDSTPDPALDDVIATGLYRSTFQTERYTRETFGEFFDILEYEERGIGNHQDLVVLRRRA